MDRERFLHLLDAYGADFRRWPASERKSAAAFALQFGRDMPELAQARALDRALDLARGADAGVADRLAARILARAPQAVQWGMDRRAMFALAACAVFGVALGFGGGMFAPPAVDQEAYYAMVFEGPPAFAFEDEG
jgi:hypothetical protein